jgi:hypothetical protein
MHHRAEETPLIAIVAGTSDDGHENHRDKLTNGNDH